jgi:hypothetical protein
MLGCVLLSASPVLLRSPPFPPFQSKHRVVLQELRPGVDNPATAAEFCYSRGGDGRGPLPGTAPGLKWRALRSLAVGMALFRGASPHATRTFGDYERG